jgi:hypothetical protein
MMVMEDVDFNIEDKKWRIEINGLTGTGKSNLIRDMKFKKDVIGFAIDFGMLILLTLFAVLAWKFFSFESAMIGISVVILHTAFDIRNKIGG